MIINDAYKFVFIHIPKCAGTTVRSKLQTLDQTGGAFTSRVDEHPELGTIDYVHIPLFILRQHFESEYVKIMDYNTFAVVRDPFSRFLSSFSQYLKRKGKGPIRRIAKDDILREIDNVINYLSALPNDQHYLSWEYTHFQRQVDYIFDDKKIVIKNIYNISDIKLMFDDLCKSCELHLDSNKTRGKSVTNQMVVYRYGLLRLLVERLRPVISPLLNTHTKRKIEQFFWGMFYISGREEMSDILEKQYIQNFIKKYYASDIEFYEGLSINKMNGDD